VTLTDPERAPDQALRTPSNLKLRMIASVGMIVVASIALTLGGVLAASIANVMQGSAFAKRYPMAPMLAIAMLIGATLDATFAWITTGPPVFELRLGYIAGILYLGIFASALAFPLYFNVIRAIGPAKAAYSGVIVPVIAMILSTIFEHYHWSTLAVAGAVLAGAGEAVVTAVGDFGREVGVAYQVVDDLLGVFGTEEATGKTTRGDLREGKRTVLVAHAATTDEWFSIQPFIGKADLSEAEAEHVRGRLEVCGARAFAEGLVEQHARRALDVLDRPEVSEALREALTPVVQDVLERVR